jgi:Golgi SNAP receptor complex protein 2
MGLTACLATALSLRPASSQRKATSVAEDTAQLSYALERVVSVHSAAVAEARSRSELFHRSVGGASAGGAFDAESQEVEANQQAFVSARRGNAALEELNDVAGAVLHALHAQRETLKSAQRRALDVLNTVGVSTALLGRAERRQRGDRALVACCAVGIALLFVWLLYVTRK